MLEIRSAKKEKLVTEPNETCGQAQGLAQATRGTAGTKQIIVLCGASHSGKSTFAQRFGDRFTIISSDAIRKEITGKYALSEDEDSVWAEFSARKERALRAGRNIVLDACHLSKKGRRHSLEGVNGGYRKICVVFDLPFSVIKERCIRENRMPLATVREIWKRFKKPTKEELLKDGFDEAHFVRTNGASS
jgi:protein phosphatase